MAMINDLTEEGSNEEAAPAAAQGDEAPAA
jgi:hypothetical protein